MSGNNSSSSSDPLLDGELTPTQLLAEIKALRAEMAEMKASTSVALVPVTPPTKAPIATGGGSSTAKAPVATGGEGRSSSPPKAATPRPSWNRYRAAQRLATRMSQAAVIAVHAILENGGSAEAAAEAGRAAAKRAATPTRGPYVLVDLPPPPPRKSKSSKH